ncbi:class I SAM-dependent methyltransferase [Auritidibacter ignavus]|uniref:class I SAM-dependent methyltransferase n=1 Tax=Auritidibacter ignavus TaxID=678932 RepID=UPI002FE6726D
MPGQTALPDRARVGTYPVHEKDGWIWVYTGDPERADITDNPEAYEYLSRTSRGFHPPQVIQRMAHEAGFRSTGYELHMFGTMAIHWGQKPLD